MNSCSVYSYMNITLWIYGILIHEIIKFSEFMCMNSCTMNSYCYIHIWIHGFILWHLCMNSRQYEFIYEYHTMKAVSIKQLHTNCLVHWTYQCSAASAQALGRQIAWKCSLSRSFSKFQPWSAGSWWVHILIFHVGTCLPQVEASLNSLSPPNGSSFGDSSLTTSLEQESIVEAFQLAL